MMEPKNGVGRFINQVSKLQPDNFLHIFSQTTLSKIDSQKFLGEIYNNFFQHIQFLSRSYLTILLLHYSHEKGYCSPFNLENGFPVSAVFFVLFVLEVTLCPLRHRFDGSNNISNAYRALTNFLNEKFQSLDIEYFTINKKYAALLKRTLSNDIPFIGQIKNVICLSGLVVVNIVTHLA